jgi:uncharacterized membrane protein YccC
MTVGTGAVLAVIGAILRWALEVNIPFVSEDDLGLILLLTGLAIVAAAFGVSERAHGTVGAGLGLMGGGAALVWAVDIDLPYVYDGSLGIILMVAGAIALVVAVTMDYQRRDGHRRVEYRRWHGRTERE